MSTVANENPTLNEVKNPYEFVNREITGDDDFQRPSITYWQDAWFRFRKDKMAMAGMIVLLILLIAAIIGPKIIPYSYEESDWDQISQWPSAEHLFGTDALGRDLLVRCLYGARISLLIGFVAAAINMVIGIIYGGVAGFVGGMVDNVMMRIVDILIALPELLYIILMMMFMGASVKSIVIALCISSWVGTARITRSQIVSLRSQEYVMAARLAGTTTPEIIRKHMIPNAMGPIIVSVMYLIPSAIFSEAFLSFLGIGIQKPMASWGSLANDAIETLMTYPYQMLFPVLMISITMFSLNFIGDGLRDALDPKQKR